MNPPSHTHGDTPGNALLILALSHYKPPRRSLSTMLQVVLNRPHDELPARFQPGPVQILAAGLTEHGSGKERSS